ncbi:hypothetical protein J1614_009668 [Plenodomus biglobosus]|nr:hypothetical protein J1614_009668 [Plenodomus biglobosus]
MPRPLESFPARDSMAPHSYQVGGGHQPHARPRANGTGKGSDDVGGPPPRLLPPSIQHYGTPA